MSSTKKWLASCWLLICSLSVIGIASLLLLMAGYHNAAWFVAYIGTPMVMFALLVYVVIWDSSSRWPNIGWVGRLTKIIWHEK